MRFTEFSKFAEARKNPAQNPKTSINDIIISAANKVTNTIAGTTNLFVSFTAVDKLGINPKSTFNTPIGIYAYPVDFVVKHAGTEKAMTSMPFAGENPYVNLFNASGNIINVTTMSAAEVDQYYQALVELWVKTSGKDRKASVSEMESIIENAATLARFPGYPGGRLWYVTMIAAGQLFSPVWGIKPPIAWNKLFRAIGIDGAVDYLENLKEQGAGIIHPGEKSQSVFFTINSVNNTKRYANKYSPAEGGIERARARGQSQHQTISAIANKIKSLSDPEEIYQYIKTDVGIKYLRLVKDPGVRTYILQKMPHAIAELPHPTNRDQYTVLSVNFSYIDYIKSPDEAVVLKVLDENPSIEYDFAKLANKMPDAGEEIQLLAVEVFPNTIARFTKPVPSAVIMALKILGRAPDWLVHIAKLTGVDYRKYIDPENSEKVRELRREYQLAKTEYESTQQQLITANADWKALEAQLAHLSQADPEAFGAIKVYYSNNISDLGKKVNLIAERMKKIQSLIQDELASHGI